MIAFRASRTRHRDPFLTARGVKPSYSGNSSANLQGNTSRPSSPSCRLLLADLVPQSRSDPTRAARHHLAARVVGASRDAPDTLAFLEWVGQPKSYALLCRDLAQAGEVSIPDLTDIRDLCERGMLDVADRPAFALAAA